MELYPNARTLNAPHRLASQQGWLTSSHLGLFKRPSVMCNNSAISRSRRNRIRCQSPLVNSRLLHRAFGLTGLAANRKEYCSGNFWLHHSHQCTNRASRTEQQGNLAREPEE